MCWPEFFTLQDVATYLNASLPHVYALVRSRESPRDQDRLARWVARRQSPTRGS